MFINRSDISEETIYVWDCPKCQFNNEDYDDPTYSETLCCSGCGEVIEITD